MSKQILTKLLSGKPTFKTVSVDLEGFDESKLCQEQLISLAHLLKIGMSMTENNKQLFPDDQLHLLENFKTLSDGQ